MWGVDVRTGPARGVACHTDDATASDWIPVGGWPAQRIQRRSDYLVGAFLIRRLPSYKANIRKRLVKAPKVFRTSDHHEIDLVLDFGTEMWAAEVKLTTSPSPADMSRLDKSADMIGATRRFLISQTRESTGDRKRTSCNLTSFVDLLHREV